MYVLLYVYLAIYIYVIARCTYDDILRPIENISLVGKHRKKELFTPDITQPKDIKY